MDLSQIFGGIGQIASMLPMYYASQRGADEMREQAGRYGALGREAAGMASPISNARRGEWDSRLSRLYEDPQGFLESNPEFMAARSLGEGKIAAMNAASGHNLGGKATADQLEFLTKLGSQYIGKERQDLMNMAGYQFNPAEGARMLMEGGRLQGEAEQAALAARLYPLGALSSMLQGGGAGGVGGAAGGLGGLLQSILGRGGDGSSGQNSGASAGSIQHLLRMFGSNPSSLAGLWQGISSIPGLQEIYGNPSEGDWTLGDGSYPYPITPNTYEPGYGSWWEGDGGGGFDPSTYWTYDDASTYIPDEDLGSFFDDWWT